jgi:hypothetical protein
VVLRAEVQKHERPVAGRDLDQVLDELLARLIKPVKVLEEDDGWLAGAACAREPPDQIKKLALARLRTERRRGPIWIWHAEELEHEWEPVGERLVEQKHPPRDLLARGLVAVLLGNSENSTQQLQDREERDALGVRQPVRLVDYDSACPAALGEFVAEPTLAGSRVGDDAENLRVPRGCLLERRLESRHLALTSDELGETARVGDVE